MEIKIVDLKQRHIEAFFKEMPVGELMKDMPFVLYWGAYVRAACKAGWYLEPVFQPDDVAEMEPGKVRELFTAATEKFTAAMEIPPS